MSTPMPCRFLSVGQTRAHSRLHSIIGNSSPPMVIFPIAMEREQKHTHPIDKYIVFKKIKFLSIFPTSLMIKLGKNDQTRFNRECLL